MITEKVKFLEDRVIEAQGKIVQRFKAGEVYELRADSARRWIRRNAAVMVFDKPHDIEKLEQLAEPETKPAEEVEAPGPEVEAKSEPEAKTTRRGRRAKKAK